MKTNYVTLNTGRRVPFRTVGDVRDEKRHAERMSEAQAPRDLSTEAQVAAAATDPRIGVLMRQGSPVYYAYVGADYFENASIDQVDAALAKFHGRAVNPV